DTLLQACLALQKAGVDFRLTLVGTGPWRLRLRLLAWRLGLRKLVSFPGQLPHEAMTDLYRRADIFIAPGHMTRGGDMDGLPSALTEAMAFGVAVVVSDLPGQLEVVQNGRNGIVVPQNDVTALSQTLLDLSASAEKRRHLGAEAWKRIREVLDEEATEARLTSLFKAACHR
ncbi:glycosyltransferase family 4 protein, partial [Desulfovibrio sp.]